MVVDFKNLLEVIRLELWRQFGSQQHSSLLCRLIHGKQALNLIWLIHGLQSFLSMERRVQVLVSDRVAHWHQDLLAFLLDDLVSDEGCSFYLISVELFKLIAILVKVFIFSFNGFQ